MPAPDLETVTAYLGDSSSWTPDEIQGALDAETVAQARVCRIPEDYPADLAEALCRRVSRNLALRALPLGVQTSISEAAVATTRIGWDADIKRLEGPFRKLVVG